jgi:hypothetical protein
MKKLLLLINESEKLQFLGGNLKDVTTNTTLEKHLQQAIFCWIDCWILQLNACEVCIIPEDGPDYVPSLPEPIMFINAYIQKYE